MARFVLEETQKARPRFVIEDGASTKAAIGGVADAAAESGSALGDLATGAGQGLRDMGLGIKQRLDEGASALSSAVGDTTIGKAINDFGAWAGMPSTSQAAADTTQQIADSRVADAQLPDSGWRTAGRITGTALPAVAASFLPGGQTLTGQALIGGLSGLAMPTAGDESVMMNTGAGAAGGAAGYGLGKLLASLYGKAAAGATAQQAQNAGRDAAAVEARQAGYVLPPSQTNPSLVNKLLEGISGKAQTWQHAAQRNQATTQRLVGEQFGLTPNAVNPAGMEGVRRAAGQAYDAVEKQLPFFVKDQQFLDDAAALAARGNPSFPGVTPAVGRQAADPLLNGPHLLDPRDTLDAVKQMRFDASINANAFRNPAERAMSGAQRSAADITEGLIDRNLAGAGRPDLVDSLRNARQVIAQAHTAEGAMNQATGGIDAQKLGAVLQKGDPISGNMALVARTAKTFKDATRDMTGHSVLPISPWDAGWGIAGSALTPAMLALPLLRAGAREAILSPWWQRTMGAASYGPGMMTRLGNSAPVQRLLPAAGMVAGQQIAAD